MEIQDLIHTLVGQARGLFDRLNSAPTRNQARLDKLKAESEVFRLSPKAHHEAILAQWNTESRDLGLKAAGVGVFNLAHALPDIRARVADVKALSRRAPDPVTSYAMRTGKRPDEKLEQYLELEVLQLDEARRARFHRELIQLPPSQIAALYDECRYAIDIDDEAASLVRWIEQRYGGGWVGSQVTTTSEIEAARRLQRSIKDAQDARVPTWIGEAEAAIAEAEKLVSRITGPAGQVTPINPAQSPDAVKAFDSELSAINGPSGPRSKHLPDEGAA